MLKGIGGDVQRALHCVYRVNNVVTGECRRGHFLPSSLLLFFYLTRARALWNRITGIEYRRCSHHAEPQALADDELAHPRLMLLLPPAASKKKLMSAGKWFNPKYWLSSEMRLHVLCAHSLRPVPLSNGEDGYPVHKPKEWLGKEVDACVEQKVLLGGE